MTYSEHLHPIEQAGPSESAHLAEKILLSDGHYPIQHSRLLIIVKVIE